MASPTTEEVTVKRMTVSMEDDLHAEVEALAEIEQRTVPNLLVYLAAKAVREAKQDGLLPTQPEQGGKQS